MRIISRKFHAVLDYVAALALIAAPWLFGFSDSKAATYAAVISGGLIFVQSIFTNYEGGLFRVLSMWTHLGSDVTLGFLLAVSPWMFGFNNVVYLPHLIMGLFLIASGFMTNGGKVYQPE